MSRITDLIDTEHELRSQLQRGELSSEQERERLRSTEEALDQCWDLLRQRRAKREFGESPDGCGRPAGVRGGGIPAVIPRGTPVPRARAAAFLSSVRASRLECDSEQRSIVRIARFAKGDGVAYGVVEGETGQPQTIAELHGHPFGVDPAGVRFTGNRYPLAEVRLLAPVLPSKVVAVGKNYAEHVKEMGGTELPAEPILFLKPSTSVTGPGDRIAYPVKITDRVDYEGELAVIIGRLCRDVPQGAGGRCHLRLHLRQRRDRQGPAGQGRAVDAGEGLRHVLPARAVDGDRRRPGRPGHHHDGQRRRSSSTRARRNCCGTCRRWSSTCRR